MASSSSSSSSSTPKRRTEMLDKVLKLAQEENVLLRSSLDVDFDVDPFQVRVEKVQELMDIVDQMLQRVDEGRIDHFEALFNLRMELATLLDQSAITLRSVDQEYPSEVQRAIDEKENFVDFFAPEERGQQEQVQEQVQEEEEEEEEGEEEDCPVCWDTRKLKTVLCGHKFCKECLEEVLKANIPTGELDNLRCPDLDCSHVFTYREIRNWGDAQLLETYDKFSALSVLHTDDSIKRCPNPGCEFIFSLTPPPEATTTTTSSSSEQEEEKNIEEMVKLMDINMVRCPLCQSSICGLCGSLDHRPETCAAKKASDSEIDWRTRRRLRSMGAQPCPNCGLAAVRVAGCSHMICSRCKSNWTWKEYDDEETKLERVAFFYPRLCREVFGSRDWEGDSTGEKAMTIGVISLFGLGCVPVTLALGLPACALRGARELKYGVRNAREDFDHWKEEKRQKEEEES